MILAVVAAESDRALQLEEKRLFYERHLPHRWMHHNRPGFTQTHGEQNLLVTTILSSHSDNFLSLISPVDIFCCPVICYAFYLAKTYKRERKKNSIRSTQKENVKSPAKLEDQINSDLHSGVHPIRQYWYNTTAFGVICSSIWFIPTPLPPKQPYNNLFSRCPPPLLENEG